MSPRELSATLLRVRNVYTVTVGDRCSLRPDLQLVTASRSHAERRHARYLRQGYPSKLTVDLRR